MAPDDITGFLSLQEKPFRIYPAGRLFTENKFSIFGIESTGGYHPAKLKIYKDYLVKTGDLANLNVLRMLNVTYVLSPVPMNDPELTLVKSGVMQLISGPETVEVYRLTGVMPRAWFARSATALASDDESIAALMSQEQQAVPGTVFLSGQSWQGTRAFAEGTILSSERKSERLAFRIKAEGDAFLVVSEVYYPKRWMASIDGRAAETILVNGLIRGVRVPAGIHDVVFSYDRSRFEAGQHVSFAALLIVALMLAAGILMNKPNLPAEQKQS
jgi:hypothetical protein